MESKRRFNSSSVIDAILLRGTVCEVGSAYGIRTRVTAVRGRLAIEPQQITPNHARSRAVTNLHVIRVLQRAQSCRRIHPATPGIMLTHRSVANTWPISRRAWVLMTPRRLFVKRLGTSSPDHRESVMPLWYSAGELRLRFYSGFRRAMLQTVGIALLAFEPFGCTTSAPSPECVAREFLTYEPPPPRRTFRRIGEEVVVDQQVLNNMRDESKRRGETLLAVALIPRGVHPYTVFAFTERSDQIQVYETAMFWGLIQGKWRATTPRSRLQDIVRSAAEFECATGPVLEPLFGAILIHWPQGAQVTCDGGWLSAASTEFMARLEEVGRAAEQTYRIPE